jgi:nicotinamidase-related amidase
MLGGTGHALVSAVEEAVFFHAVAREISPAFQIKGDDPRTEAYSALGPEVGGAKNHALVKLLGSFDRVLVAGQAKSHCVAWTVEDLLEEVPAERLYLLEDCMSPVVVPDVVDFTAEADAAVTRFAERGVRIIRSTEPIQSWP